MIILDTNVISEPTKPLAAAAVLAWLDRQQAESLYLTATGLAELLLGIESLTEGRRKQLLKEASEALLKKWFGPRILPFDEAAAAAYARLVSRARAGGYAISVPDGQIAAIADVLGFSVATRDTGPFLAAGISIINPWSE